MTPSGCLRAAIVSAASPVSPNSTSH
jgi:hypothetical protein